MKPPTHKQRRNVTEDSPWNGQQIKITCEAGGVGLNQFPEGETYSLILVQL